MTSPPVDRLANVKAFLYSLALDGYGMRRFMSDSIGLGDGRRFITEKATTRLYRAVMADDPNYKAEGPPSVATSMVNVKKFAIWCLRRKMFMEEIGANTGPIYEMMFQPGQYGCFWDAFVTALKADDPNWSPPVMDPED